MEKVAKREVHDGKPKVTEWTALSMGILGKVRVACQGVPFLRDFNPGMTCLVE
jgi:hypothetical protein